MIWRDVGSIYDVRLGRGRHPLRYRTRGTIVFEGGVEVSHRNVDVTIEGFDVATGKTTWSVALGADRSLVSGDARLPVAGTNQVVLQAPAGPIVLDVATGQTSAPAAGATFWCMSNQRYEFLPSYETDEGKDAIAVSVFSVRGEPRRVAALEAHPVASASAPRPAAANRPPTQRTTID